ncbi:MAG TPA: hypothetical protein VMN36_02845 [Verrucomicrobiales bacterium]|nr:hypothetical protein [Verrucomicrobiales bacterium]
MSGRRRVCAAGIAVALTAGAGLCLFSGCSPREPERDVGEESGRASGVTAGEQADDGVARPEDGIREIPRLGNARFDGDLSAELRLADPRAGDWESEALNAQAGEQLRSLGQWLALPGPETRGSVEAWIDPGFTGDRLGGAGLEDRPGEHAHFPGPRRSPWRGRADTRTRCPAACALLLQAAQADSNPAIRAAAIRSLSSPDTSGFIHDVECLVAALGEVFRG